MKERSFSNLILEVKQYIALLFPLYPGMYLEYMKNNM